jgi:hypothetical protein
MNIHPEEGKTAYSIGKGKVYITRADPKEIILTQGKDSSFIRLAEQAYKEATHAPLVFKNYLYLERGCYTIAAVLDESVNDQPLTIKGPVIDLFDPALPVLTEKIVKPGEQAYLYATNRIVDKQRPKVLCAAARVYDERKTKGSYSFIVKSPSGTQNVMRILLPSQPKTIRVGATENMGEWDAASHTCLLKFANDHKGVPVSIRY